MNLLNSRHIQLIGKKYIRLKIRILKIKHKTDFLNFSFLPDNQFTIGDIVILFDTHNI